MAVVVSPLNIFQGKLCGILSRYLTPLVPAWYRFAAFFYPILLIFGAILVNFCVLCGILSRCLAPLDAAWFCFAAFSSHFVAILVDIYVLCASCLVF